MTEDRTPQRIKEKLLQLLYPDDVCCAVCECEAILCEGCCEACAKALRPAPDKAPAAPLRGCQSVWSFEEPLRSTIHRFKFHGHTYLAPFLAQYMDPPVVWEADALVPVPLFPRRERKRGYNQSALLAEEIARRTGLSLRRDILFRIRDTASQTELDEAQRRENMKGAFAVKGACRGLRILLIDDVCTTGNTLSACAQTLLHAGAAAVYALTAAQTPY